MSLISNAYAATETAGGAAAHHGPSMAPMLIVLAIVLVFYFWLWRQQGKKTKNQQKVLETLGKGDEVITAGGIVGKITAIKDDFVTLMVAKETNIMIQKPSISSVLPKGTMKDL